MSNIFALPIHLSVDHILRAQGADPAILRARSPRVAETVKSALQMGLPLLKPVVVYETYQVTGVLHHRIQMGKGAFIQNSVVAGELKNASSLIVCVCTIGPELEMLSRKIMADDPAAALALDALGSAAVEQLSMEICEYLEKCSGPGQYCSRPLGPGIDGWSVSEGQSAVFNLVDGASIGVTLTKDCLMLPIKSASFILGVSDTPFSLGSMCDLCNLKETCRYRGNQLRAEFPHAIHPVLSDD